MINTDAMQRAAERVANWPEWKRKAGGAFIAMLDEGNRILPERSEHVRKYGEQ
jgi:hypothetical protein